MLQTVKTQARPPKPRTVHTFVAYVDDLPGVLNRVVSLFRRRNYNIDSLTAGHTEVPGVSRLTIVSETDEATARLIEANLYKLVNVLRVEDVSLVSTVRRELALIKVLADLDNRTQLLQACDVFRARAVDVVPDAVIVEICGTEEKVQNFIDVLRPFEVIEMVRTGSIAMTRGAETLTVDPHFISARVPRNGKGDGNGDGNGNGNGHTP